MGFWEQLPYTNFHDLNLTELVKFVNETIKKINEMSADIVEQNQVINDFKNYVMDYLNNLDVEQDVKDYIDELISNGTMATLVNKSIFSGKNIVWYGDSWGTTADNPVQKFIDEYTDTTVTNRCIGGTLMTRSTEFPGYEYNSGYQLITSANDLADFDYIFIMYGVNDWQTSRVLKTGTPDEYEYLYCVENVIDYLQVTYPTCIPVFIFQTYCYRNFATSDMNGVNYAGVNLPSYINNAIDICEKRNVKYINLFDLSGITRKNYQTHLRNDSGVYVHLKSDMSEQVAKLIYWGKFNTGHCYGDNWSNDIITSQIDTSSVLTRAERDTVTSGVVSFPKKKIGTSDAHNLVFNPSNDETTVIHLTFYKDDTNINGLYVDRQNVGGSNTRLGITNIDKVGLVDCYIEFDYSDMISMAIVRDSGDAVLSGINATVRTTNKDIYAEYIPLNGSSDISDVSSVHGTIKNGVVTVPSFTFTANSNISAYTDLITDYPRQFLNEAIYFLAVDLYDSKVTPMYNYNGTIKALVPLISTHSYLIPELTYHTAH